MWSSLALMLTLLTGCSSTPEPAADAPAAQAKKAAKTDKGAKNKGAKGGKAAKAGKGAKGKAAKGKKAAGASKLQPVGAAGPVVGELKLSPVEDAPKAPPAPAAAPGEGEEAAPAEVATVARTQADLLLTFGEAGEATVTLGKVKGTCAELPPEPVGPEGKQQTPLWTLRCGEGDKTVDLFVLQVGDGISVVRAVPPTTEGQAATWRPVKRVPLAKGAELQRKG